MAWSWSHTTEAYQNAETNTHGLALKTLQVIWAEWKAHTSREDDEAGFNEEKYKAALRLAHGKSATALAEDIWQWASELATCTNGGFEAWLCPFGCGCHMVPFDRNFGLFRSAAKRGFPTY